MGKRVLALGDRRSRRSSTGLHSGDTTRINNRREIRRETYLVVVVVLGGSLGGERLLEMTITLVPDFRFIGGVLRA